MSRREHRGVRAAAVAVLAAAVVVPRASTALEPAPTVEAVAVWQERLPGGDWDVSYAILGRPSPETHASELAWRATGGGAAAPIAAIPGDDQNPHVALRPGAGTPAIAAWDHRDAATGARDIWWSTLDPASASSWSVPAPIAATGGDDFDPAVAIDENLSAIAVWVNEGSLKSATWSAGVWSEPAPLPGSFTSASLPELTFLDATAAPGETTRHQALVAYVDVSDGMHRTFTARWDGSSWSPGTPVPLTAAQESILPEHGSASYSLGGAFTRIGLAPDAGGGANVLWSGPVTEALAGRYSGKTIMGARLAAAGTWSPMQLEDGSVALSGGCYGPDAVMTGFDDVVAVHGSTASVVEYSRLMDGEVTFGAPAYDSRYDDVRPSGAPLADRVLSVSSGLTYSWDAESSSRIVWSLGTLRPESGVDRAHTTWEPSAVLPTAGEARHPEVASVVGGTSNPLRVTKTGRAFAAGVASQTLFDTGAQTGAGDGDARTAAVEPTTLGPVTLAGVEAVSSRTADSSTSKVTVAEAVVATVPPITIRGVRVVAAAACAFGGRGFTTLVSIQSGTDPPVAVDARQNSSVPVGAFTVRVNEIQGTMNGTIVRGVRVVGPGVDAVVGYAEASVTGCVGSGPPLPTGPGHGH